MATSVHMSIDYAAIGRLAKSEELRADLARRAERVAQRARAAAGPGEEQRIESSAIVGRSRARASVIWVGGLGQEIARRVLGGAVDGAS